jgi:signal transduction histidine kinase
MSQVNLSLRGRLLMLVLLGVVFPLGLLGFWNSYSARRAGIALVHDRLQEALTETVNEFQQQWIQRRSLILDVSEAGAVVAALDGTRPWEVPIPDSVRDELSEIWTQVSRFVVFVELRDPQGRLVGRLPDALGAAAFGLTPPQGTLDREFPVLTRFSGEELGTMMVRFRMEGLLPPGFLAQGVGGSVPAIFDIPTGLPLVPLTLEPTLFSRRQFTWRGDDWVTEERTSVEPTLRFALAAPIEPVTASFDRVARRGAAAILLAVVLSFALVSVFSRRLMRPLDRLVTAAEAVASGDLTARVEESGPPGIRDTAKAFNTMSSALDRTLKELSRKEAIAAVGEFAADLAHEVRNPLTAIRTDLQRAQRKLQGDPETALALVGRAVDSVDRLNVTVRDFLRVARSGTVSLASCDLRGPIMGAIRACEPQRREKNIPLEYEEPIAPMTVMGDAGALQGMFLNLLLNAVEAVEPGSPMGVRVFVRSGESERSLPQVTAEVWDRGAGIQEDVQSTLFDPFVTTKLEGTGLGLAIASRVARAHGSELESERRAGETIFRFSLPALDHRAP